LRKEEIPESQTRQHRFQDIPQQSYGSPFYAEHTADIRRSGISGADFTGAFPRFIPCHDLGGQETAAEIANRNTEKSHMDQKPFGNNIVVFESAFLPVFSVNKSFCKMSTEHTGNLKNEGVLIPILKVLADMLYFLSLWVSPGHRLHFGVKLNTETVRRSFHCL
jgi:hypothetical protein